MANNRKLNHAERGKKDEFYTMYKDIQDEVEAFWDQFKGKTVYCNCDDPLRSNFCRYFLDSFMELGLQRLICTSYAGPYAGEQLSLFADYDAPEHSGGYVFDVNYQVVKHYCKPNKHPTDLLHEWGRIKRLKGDGSFASDECVAYLKQVDIVVTNPPFSKFRQFIKLLVDYQKHFLIIGNHYLQGSVSTN